MQGYVWLYHCNVWLKSLSDRFSILRGHKLSEFPGVSEFCDELYSKHIRSPLLLSMMVDIYEERALATDTTEHAQNFLAKALEVCNPNGWN